LCHPKSRSITLALRRRAARHWGQTAPAALRTIYRGAILPILTYASPVWINKLNRTKVQRKYLSLYGTFARLLTSSYVMRLVDRLPNAVRQTNQPKHIKPFLLRITYIIFSSNLHNKLLKDMLRDQVGISNDLASLLYCCSSVEIITSRTPSAKIISAARQLVRCHDNEVTL
jgi:hypothetical protein